MGPSLLRFTLDAGVSDGKVNQETVRYSSDPLRTSKARPLLAFSLSDDPLLLCCWSRIFGEPQRTRQSHRMARL